MRGMVEDPFGRDPPRSIVVAQLAFIGDVVFTTPLIDELAELWPGAAIAVVGRPRSVEILDDHPAVAALIPYDKDDADRGLAGASRAARGIRERRPDMFLGVSRSLRTAFLARVSGARRRVGFAGPGRWLAYNRRVERDDARCFPERPLVLLEALGHRPRPRPMHLVVGDARREEARRSLAAAGWRGEPLLALAPGAHFATKRWPERHVARFLDLLAADGRLRPALYGGPEEDGLIARLLTGRPAILDRRGIGIRGVLADLTQARVFVGGDSGPSHMARALGTPAVVLYGPTAHEPLRDGRPYVELFRELPCRPCSPRGDAVCPLGHHACLEGMAPEDVLRAVLSAAGLRAA